MDPWFVVALALVVATAVLAWVATRRGRTIARVRRTLGAPEEADLASEAARQRRTLEARTRELAGAREATSSLLEALGPGVLTLGADLRVIEANRAAHRLLERPAGGLPGRTIMEAFLDTTVESTARTALAVGSAATEIRLAGADGPAVLVRAQRSPSGGVWLFLDDVSELRRLQRIRAEFIDNLSHELRTPLTTVSLLAETLSRDASTAGTAVPARMRDRIAKIEVETGHLVQMVNELLDLSRIEGGGTIAMTGGIDLGRLATEAAERLRLFAERQGVDLRVSAEPGLPTVRGDVMRLGQVLVNLVHNAVKFSPDGGPVTLRAARAGDEVVVSVEDHGIGIPAGDRDRVFERFYKVDRARQRPAPGGGTGLGLAIARHVVEQHGGRIWLESQEGVGSTFRFALPGAAGPDGRHAPARPEER